MPQLGEPWAPELPTAATDSSHQPNPRPRQARARRTYDKSRSPRGRHFKPFQRETGDPRVIASHNSHDATALPASGHETAMADGTPAVIWALTHWFSAGPAPPRSPPAQGRAPRLPPVPLEGREPSCETHVRTRRTPPHPATRRLTIDLRPPAGSPKSRTSGGAHRCSPQTGRLQFPMGRHCLDLRPPAYSGCNRQAAGPLVVSR